MTSELFDICKKYEFSNKTIEFIGWVEKCYGLVGIGNMLKTIEESIKSDDYGLNKRDRFIFELGVVSISVNNAMDCLEDLYYKNGNKDKGNIVDFAKEVVRRNMFN